MCLSSRVGGNVDHGAGTGTTRDGHPPRSRTRGLPGFSGAARASPHGPLTDCWDDTGHGQTGWTLARIATCGYGF
jgi:hypothetical protein